jgi:hypothetical protein
MSPPFPAGYWLISAGADAKGGNAVLWDAAKLLPVFSVKRRLGKSIKNETEPPFPLPKDPI